MKFTVVFRTHESFDHSYGLEFIPCPCWVMGGSDILINLNPENPHYQLGSVSKLLKSKFFTESYGLDDKKECIIVIHPTGHGSKVDLETLIKDLQNEGFVVRTVEF
jgi:hypothetical protein